MAGLNNLLADTQQTQTTLPSWYDQAQQNIVSQGTAAAAAAPQLNQTVAQGAINQLQPGAQNPFTQAQGTLQQISSGAANPWIVDQTTGAVTPNTNTAMGGLFAAERDQLNQLLPTTTAPAMAAGIGSGNFGSLRGQTAVNTAKGNAFNTLMAQQMQSALSNQTTGANAAANLGNVANQGINTAMNVGTAQQNAPFQNVGNLASLLGTIQAPTTVTNQTQLSPLSQAATIGTAATGGLNSLTQLAKTPVGASLLKSIGLGSAFGLGGGSNSGSTVQVDAQGHPTGTTQLSGGGEITFNGDGSQSIKDANGVVTNYDPNGNVISANTNYDGTPTSPDYPDIGGGSMPTDSSGNIDYSGDNWGEG